MVNPQLDGDPGTIIVFPGESFGLNLIYALGFDHALPRMSAIRLRMAA
jgi:hypothetical protein